MHVMAVNGVVRPGKKDSWVMVNPVCAAVEVDEEEGEDGLMAHGNRSCRDSERSLGLRLYSKQSEGLTKGRARDD